MPTSGGRFRGRKAAGMTAESVDWAGRREGGPTDVELAFATSRPAGWRRKADGVAVPPVPTGSRSLPRARRDPRRPPILPRRTRACRTCGWRRPCAPAGWDRPAPAQRMPGDPRAGLPRGARRQRGQHRGRQCRVAQHRRQRSSADALTEQVFQHAVRQAAQHRGRYGWVGPHLCSGRRIGVGGSGRPGRQVRHTPHPVRPRRQRGVSGRWRSVRRDRL